MSLVPGTVPSSHPSNFVRTNWTKVLQLFSNDECLPVGFCFPSFEAFSPPLPLPWVTLAPSLPWPWGSFPGTEALKDWPAANTQGKKEAGAESLRLGEGAVGAICFLVIWGFVV